MRQHCWNNRPPKKLLLKSVPFNKIKTFFKTTENAASSVLKETKTFHWIKLNLSRYELSLHLTSSMSVNPVHSVVPKQLVREGQWPCGVCLGEGTCELPGKRHFGQMVKNNLTTDFFTTLPIRDELMMGIGGGDKLHKPKLKAKVWILLPSKVKIE